MADKDVTKEMRRAQKAGWTFEPAGKSSHVQGWLACGDGCRIVIYSTPKGSSGFKTVKRALAK